MPYDKFSQAATLIVSCDKHIHGLANLYPVAYAKGDVADAPVASGLISLRPGAAWLNDNRPLPPGGPVLNQETDMVTHDALLRDDSQDRAVRAAFNHPKSYAALYDGVSFRAYLFQERIKLVLGLIGEREGREGPGCRMRAGYDGAPPDRQELEGLRAGYVPRDGAGMPGGLGRSDRSAFLSGRLESLPFKEGTFDAVLGMGVLEYVADAQAALAELARVTKPGGVLVVTMLNRTSLWIVCHRLYNWIRFFRHRLAGRPANRPPRLKLFSERGLRKPMESAGLLPSLSSSTGLISFPLRSRLRMPNHAIRISSGIDALLRNHLQSLSSAFIVKARKQ